MTLVLNSVEPDTAFADGGYPLEIDGTFPIGEDLRVHVGPSGDSSDPVAYSGKPGRGENIRPYKQDRVRFYTPALEPGGPYHVFVVVPGTGEDATLSSAVTATKPDFKTKVFGLRGVLPPTLKTGPRNMDGLEPV